MRAVVVEAGELHLRGDLPPPAPGPREVRIDVRAAGVNHVDLLRKPSHFGSDGGANDAAAVAGIEAAGIVGAFGDGATRFACGDRVMAMVAGGYAEHVCVDERLCVPIPESFGWEEAAATMVSFMTAHDALVTRARMQPGETVLVLGCTTSAGIATAQLAKHFGAGCVVGTSTSADKLAGMRSFAVDIGVLASTGDVAAVTLRASKGKGAEVIVDMVGALTAAEALAAAAIGARWINVGRVGGKNAQLDLAEFARKQLQLIGVTFRTRTLDERIDVVDRFAREVLPALATGALRPKVDRTFELDQAAAAQARIATRTAFGKVVLRVS